MSKFILILVAILSTHAFAGVRTYNCDYTNFADQDGIDTPRSPFLLKFVFDTTTNEAMMIGNAGMSPMIVVKNQEQISFVEINGAKNVMTTTIDSKQNSVHSRNTVIFGNLTPSQYYGSCTIESSY